MKFIMLSLIAFFFGCGDPHQLGRTAQGVLVVQDGVLDHPVDVETIGTVYDSTLHSFSNKWGTSLETLRTHLARRGDPGGERWRVQLQHEPWDCGDDDPWTHCAGWADAPSTMMVVWRNLFRPPSGELLDTDDFCVADTALSHELTHLLLWHDQHTLDRDHRKCWNTVTDANNASRQLVCP